MAFLDNKKHTYVNDPVLMFIHTGGYDSRLDPCDPSTKRFIKGFRKNISDNTEMCFYFEKVNKQDYYTSMVIGNQNDESTAYSQRIQDTFNMVRLGFIFNEGVFIKCAKKDCNKIFNSISYCEAYGEPRCVHKNNFGKYDRMIYFIKLESESG